MVMLPEEVIVYIFGFLPTSTLAIAAQVCKIWHRLVQDGCIWRPRCIDRWPFCPIGRYVSLSQYLPCIVPKSETHIESRGRARIRTRTRIE